MAKRPRVESDEAPLTSNPFAGLLGGAELPDAPDPAPTDEAAPSGVPQPPTTLANLRLTVRRQKKGHGGKTVTCVEGLPPAALADLISRLKKELGCSARSDADVLVAGTGDHKRVAEWLRGRGANRVVLGN